MFQVGDSKIVFSYVRRLPKYIFMASWPKFQSKKEKRDKILYKVLKTRQENSDTSPAISRNLL